MTGGVGTLFFMAPEILNNNPNYTEKVDAYSFAVLTYFILSQGKMPKTSIAQICLGKKSNLPESFTGFAKEMIDACWNFDPKERPSFDQIYAQLVDNCDKLVEMSPEQQREVKIQVQNHIARISSQSS